MPCRAVRVRQCTRCWANSHQTGAGTLHLHPRHHLHRPFPACGVIPAPALPTLPSHTYQPPAAVPLPGLGSVDKQQQLIHLPHYFLSLLYVFDSWFLVFLNLSYFNTPSSIISKHVAELCFDSISESHQDTFALNHCFSINFSQSVILLPLPIIKGYIKRSLAGFTTTPIPKFPWYPCSDGTDILFL